MDRPDPVPDLSLRVVRYFVVVAENAHFGRAAEALHVGQPTLSRQIRELERQLGSPLLERTSHGSQLTDAGRAFLPKARALLLAATEAAAAVHDNAGAGSLAIGYSPGLVVTAPVQDLRRTHPDATVKTVYLGWRRPGEALLNREVDVVVARMPFTTTGLEITPLYDEPRLVVVPADHRLAGRTSVSVEDIGSEPMPWVADVDAACRAFWRLEPRPGGAPAPTGPAMPSLDDAWELVAQGQTLAVVAESHRPIVRPDLTLVPLTGVEPSRTVLAARAGETSTLAGDFRRCALTHLTRRDRLRPIATRRGGAR